LVLAGMAVKRIDLETRKQQKEGQLTMFYGIHRCYQCTCIHWHKLQKYPEGFNQQGPAEVFDLVMPIDSIIFKWRERQTKSEQNTKSYWYWC
jgi:hypothetical protein